MLRKLAIVVATGVVGLALLVAAAPALLYLWGRSLLPADRAPVDPAAFTPLAIEFTWIQFGGEGPPRFEALDPYTYLSRARSPEYDAISNTAFSAARVLLFRHRTQYPPRPWPVAAGAGTIWVSRHWSAEEALASVLESANYGHGFTTFAGASRGYFGADPEQLSPYQTAQLVALTWSSTADPWCRPARSAEKSSQLLARHWREMSPGSRTVLPMPEGACR